MKKKKQDLEAQLEQRRDRMEEYRYLYDNNNNIDECIDIENNEFLNIDNFENNRYMASPVLMPTSREPSIVLEGVAATTTSITTSSCHPLERDIANVQDTLLRHFVEAIGEELGQRTEL